MAVQGDDEDLVWGLLESPTLFGAQHPETGC